MDLPEHRPGAAHLPHQPFERPIARLALVRQELARLVGEIDHDRSGLHQGHAIVVIDDGRDLVVGADLQEIGGELLVIADIDRMRRVGQSELFQQNRDLAAIGGRPRVEVDHRQYPRLSRRVPGGLRTLQAGHAGCEDPTARMALPICA